MISCFQLLLMRVPLNTVHVHEYTCVCVHVHVYMCMSYQMLLMTSLKAWTRTCLHSYESVQFWSTNIDIITITSLQHFSVTILYPYLNTDECLHKATQKFQSRKLNFVDFIEDPLKLFLQTFTICRYKHTLAITETLLQTFSSEFLKLSNL